MQIKGILKAAGGLSESVGTAFDKNFTSAEERLEAKTKLVNAANEIAMQAQELQADIIKTETQGGKLQRSWRPIVMLAFAFIIVYAYFLQPAFFPNQIDIRHDLPDKFWDLLSLGMGGFVIGRSAEKISTKVSEAVGRRERRRDRD